MSRLVTLRWIEDLGQATPQPPNETWPGDDTIDGRDELLGAHQASHPLAATTPPEASQLGMHAWHAVGAPRPIVDLDDHPGELSAAHRTHAAIPPIPDWWPTGRRGGLVAGARARSGRGGRAECRSGRCGVMQGRGRDQPRAGGPRG